ncbi:MAG: hypothetical protein J6K82_00615 [Alphaproteobacteria bacterium]|nr:hypothetical protein [Alphaproteobacteria bacterium]
MKIKCDFCKTEYGLDRAPTTPVKCAVCGHCWSVPVPARRSAYLMFFASVCALLSAIVFTVAVITRHQATHNERGPLLTNIAQVTTTTDEGGVSRLVVNGSVINISDQIYGVPDLIIVSSDDDGRILARQKFMPSATLLDAGASVDFSHVLAPQPSGVRKISAHLADIQPSDTKPKEQK